MAVTENAPAAEEIEAASARKRKPAASKKKKKSVWVSSSFIFYLPLLSSPLSSPSSPSPPSPSSSSSSATTTSTAEPTSSTTSGGGADWNGWTTFDWTVPQVHHWQVSNYNQADPANLAAWCGDINFESCDDSLDPDGGGGADHWVASAVPTAARKPAIMRAGGIWRR